MEPILFYGLLLTMAGAGLIQAGTAVHQKDRRDGSPHDAVRAPLLHAAGLLCLVTAMTLLLVGGVQEMWDLL